MMSVYEQYPHGAEAYGRLSMAGYQVGIGRGGALYAKGKGGVRDKKVYAQYAEALRDDAFLIEQIKGYIRGVKKSGRKVV